MGSTMNFESRVSGIGKFAGGRAKMSVSSHVLSGLIAGLDSLAVLGTALISYLLLVGNYLEAQDTYVAAVCFVWLVVIMVSNFAGLYRLEPIMRPIAFADKVIVTFATTTLFLLAAAYSLKVSTDLSRLWLGSFIAASCAVTILFRILFAAILRHLAGTRVFTRHVVIAGSGEQARRLTASLDASRPRFISVLGVFGDTSKEAWKRGDRYPVLGDFDDLITYVRDHKIDDVIVALPWSADEQIARLTNKLRQLPVNVYLGSDLIGFQLPFRSPPDHFGELPVVEVVGRPLAGWGSFQKAALDGIVGPIAICIMLPVMILIAIADQARQQRAGAVSAEAVWVRQPAVLHLQISHHAA